MGLRSMGSRMVSEKRLMLITLCRSGLSAVLPSSAVRLAGIPHRRRTSRHGSVIHGGFSPQFQRMKGMLNVVRKRVGNPSRGRKPWWWLPLYK